MRRLLPPGPLALSPSEQRRLNGTTKADLDRWLTSVGLPREPRSRGRSERSRAILIAAAERAAESLFTQGSTHMAERRRKTSATVTEATKEVDTLFDATPAQKANPGSKPLPELRPELYAVQETMFAKNIDGLYDRLVGALSVREALTPGVLAEVCNRAESNALEATSLYLVAKADFERFERECEPVFESMRDAANRDLQAEKDKGQRSKAITDADIRGRASILFPDEWKKISDRRVKAEAMIEQLKKLASLWEQRCFTLGTMLNAGKRS